MKRYIFMIAIVACVVVSFYPREKKKTVPPVRVLRIGSECDYVPNSWEEKAPTPFNVPVTNHKGYYADGYDIQIAKLVANELGMSLDVRKIAWNELISALKNNEIDAVFSSMLDTEERKKSIDFSDSYEANKIEYAVIVDSVGSYITAKSLADFSGARITGQRGTTLDDVIDQIPGVIHLKPETVLQGMIDAILDNRADGAVIDVDTGQYYETMNKNLTLIKFSDDEGFKLGFSGVCVGLRKGNTELRHRINLALGHIPLHERQRLMSGASSRMMNVH